MDFSKGQHNMIRKKKKILLNTLKEKRIVQIIADDLIRPYWNKTSH